MKTDYDLAISAHEQYHLEANRILLLMTQFNEQNKRDPAQWAMLTRNMEFNQKQMAIESKEREEAQGKLKELKLEYYKVAFSKLKKIVKLSAPVSVAIRGELGISTDITDLKSKLEKRFAKAEIAIDGFIEKIADESD